MTNIEEFATRLTALRIQNGSSAREMSLSIGQNPGYINNIESLKTYPSMNSFFFICEFLHITPEEFFDTTTAYPEEMHIIIEKLKRLNPRTLSHINLLLDDILKS